MHMGRRMRRPYIAQQRCQHLLRLLFSQWVQPQLRKVRLATPRVLILGSVIHQ